MISLPGAKCAQANTEAAFRTGDLQRFGVQKLEVPGCPTKVASDPTAYGTCVTVPYLTTQVTEEGVGLCMHLSNISSK